MPLAFAGAALSAFKTAFTRLLPPSTTHVSEDAADERLRAASSNPGELIPLLAFGIPMSKTSSALRLSAL
jgi:hypothetical protein